MKDLVSRWTCDYCGKQVKEEIPSGWIQWLFIGADGSRQEWHFCCYECYKKWHAANPDKPDGTYYLCSEAWGLR